MGSSKQTTGYQYFLGLHMILGHSGIDRLHRVRVDDRDVFRAVEGVVLQGTLEPITRIVNATFFPDGVMRLSEEDGTWLFNNFSTSEYVWDENAEYPYKLTIINSEFSGEYTVLNVSEIAVSEGYESEWDATGDLDIKLSPDFGTSVVTGIRNFSIAITQEIEANAGTTGGVGAGRYYIDAGDVFGGKESQGGIQGYFNFETGYAGQQKSTYLSEQLGADNIPTYKGVAGLVCEQMYIGTNPYLKPWKFLVSAINKDNRGNDIWYKEKAALDWDMNAAHVIYLALTNKDWGLGFDPSELDEINFRSTADTLYDEGFGLSFIVKESSSMEDFIGEVLTHIGAALILDKETKKLAINLLRDDFEIDDLPIFDVSVVKKVMSYERAQISDLYNALIVKYWNRLLGQVSTYRIQDIASIQVQGSEVEKSVEYTGITNLDLAAKVAARDLRSLSYPLITAEIEVNRLGATINIGDPIRVQLPEYNLADVVFRVLSASEDNVTKGTIKLKIFEDIYKTPQAVYVGSFSNLGGRAYPTVVDADVIEEMPYALARFYLPSEVFTELDFGEGLIFGMACSADKNLLGFQVKSDLDGVTTSSTLTEFTACGVLSNGTTNQQSVMQISLGTSGNAGYLGFILLGGEWLEVTSYNNDGSANVKRGCLDTFPIIHNSGETIWLLGVGEVAVVESLFIHGETLTSRSITSNSQGVLPTSLATATQTTITSRASRPYPAANVKIDGVLFNPFVNEPSTFNITWQGRDKITQDDNFVDWFLDSGTLEDGMTFNLRLYDDVNGGLLEEFTGITGISQAVNPQAGFIRLELESEVNGITSNVFIHKFSRTEFVSGYGYDYGKDYGGSA